MSGEEREQRLHPRCIATLSLGRNRRATTYNGPVSSSQRNFRPMLTDAPPRTSYLTGFRESDRITTLDLPEDARLSDIAKAIESAMKSDQIRNLRRACAGFLKFASEFYRVPDCGVRVLAASTRERQSYTIMHAVRHKSTCSGYQYPTAAGASIGGRRIEVRHERRCARTPKTCSPLSAASPSPASSFV